MNSAGKKKMPHVLLINGPNLNLLGRREPDIYGSLDLAGVESGMQELAAELNISLACRQSNHEGEIVDWIQAAMADCDFIIINAGALTHYSVALYDALKASGLPFIEIHISNIYAREEFRHKSLLSPIASGIIAGLGTSGYRLALIAAAELLKVSSAIAP